MRAVIRLAIAITLLALIGGGPPARLAAQAPASWLHVPLSAWNAAGASVAKAPTVETGSPATCAAQERPAATAEDSQLTSAEWRLLQPWPLRRVSVSDGTSSVSVALVMASAGYDGMCRPWEFNAFVFVDTQYAGTLSPVAMDSRSDGVLSGQPAVLRGGRLEATFTRYAPSDPLCCPSRGTTRVSYQLTRQPAGWVVLSEAAAPAALRLPATGRRPIRKTSA